MKKRIIGATLITVVCALLISNLVGVLLFRSREMDAARNTLQELLVLMDAQSAITDPDGLAQQFHAAAPDKRLTIIDTDGTVLADTEANPQTLEDHNSRPEVEQAAATGWGEAVRHSETLGTSMLYVSKRFADGMVGRASMPLSSIDSLVWNGVWGFLIASAAGLLLALILARRTANRVVAPLSAVGSALQSVLDGTRASGLEDYQADDELRPILRYIDKLMERLGGYIQSITAERDKVGLILDCMDEGLILLDEAGNVLAINRAARTLFGFPEGEEDDGALLLTRSRRLREAIQESRVRHSSVVLDVDALTEDAQSLRLFISPVSGRQYEGQAVGTSILISDVTELKKAEGIRSEFTANVSHELKTPLTSIKGFTDMLASGMVASPEDQKRFITMIGVEVDRLIDLINDILKLSELESVTIPQSEERSDVLVGETAKNLSERFGKILQQRQSLSINRQDTSTSINTQMDALIPPSKISGLTQGMFVGSVSDNFNERIEQKIFHCEIVVDAEKVKREERAYKKIPVITDFTDEDGNDRMKETVQANYRRIKEEVKQIVQEELERIAGDDNLKYLLQQK